MHRATRIFLTLTTFFLSFPIWGIGGFDTLGQWNYSLYKTETRKDLIILYVSRYTWKDYNEIKSDPSSLRLREIVMADSDKVGDIQLKRRKGIDFNATLEAVELLSAEQIDTIDLIPHYLYKEKYVWRVADTEKRVYHLICPVTAEEFIWNGKKKGGGNAALVILPLLLVGAGAGTGIYLSKKKRLKNPERVPREESPEKERPRLVLSRQSLGLYDHCGENRSITVEVVSGSGETVGFSCRIEESLEEGLETVKVEPAGRNKGILVIVPRELEEGTGSVSNRVVITATREGGAPMEEALNVTVIREGLVMVGESPLTLVADGVTEARFKVTAYRVDKGTAETDYDLLSRLRFEDKVRTDLRLAANAFESAGLEILTKGWEYGEPDCFVYHIKTRRFLPGLGEPYFGRLTGRATVPGGNSGVVVIPLFLDSEALDRSEAARDIELERCRIIILRVPEAHRPKLNAILDRQADFLGARGLREFRFRIWRIGQLLWEAEGLSGYNDLERWAGYLENACRFTEFSCKIVLSILMTSQFGAIKALAAAEAGNFVVSALTAWQNGESFDSWLDKGLLRKFLPELTQNLAGELTEQALEEWIKKEPRALAAAVLLLFLFYWITNMGKQAAAGNRMSFYDAAKEALGQVSIMAAGKFLAAKLQRFMVKPVKAGADPAIDPEINTLDFEKGILSAKGKISALDDAIEAGDPDRIRKLVLDGKTDKFFIAEINKIHQGVPLYSDSLKKTVNRIFESEVKKPVRELLDHKVLDFYSRKGYREVELVYESRSNPSDMVKVGSDWDVSYKVTALDAQGKPVLVDMKAAELEPLLSEAVTQAAGKKFPPDLTPGELLHHTDISAMGSDALGGYGKSVDAALEMKRVDSELDQYSPGDIRKGFETLNGADLSNPEILENLPPPADLLAKIRIEDPSALSRGAAYKELEWFDAPTGVSAEISGQVAAGVAKQGKMLEGMKQLAKQYNNLLIPMKNINDKVLSRRPTEIPSLLRETVDLFNRGRSPEYIEKLLRKKGTTLKGIVKTFEDEISFYSNNIAGMYKGASNE
jgi:hypothetical protein